MMGFGLNTSQGIRWWISLSSSIFHQSGVEMPTLDNRNSTGEDQVESTSRQREAVGNLFKSGRKYLLTWRRNEFLEKLSSHKSSTSKGREEWPFKTRRALTYFSPAESEIAWEGGGLIARHSP